MDPTDQEIPREKLPAMGVTGKLEIVARLGGQAGDSGLMGEEDLEV
jgi:hypothetical protein